MGEVISTNTRMWRNSSFMPQLHLDGARNHNKFAAAELLYSYLFDEFQDSDLKNEFVLSGLQAFETSLFLMSAGRWPSTTLLLWEACEKLLRVVAKGRGRELDDHGRKLDAAGLQAMFKEENHGLSDGLHKISRTFRRHRNTIAHRGYSPKDDKKSQRLFFEAGVPYFDSLLRYLFSGDKTRLTGKSGEWFWSIYSDTRKVLEKKRRKKITDNGQSFFFLQLAGEKIFSLQHASQWISRFDEKRHVLEHLFQWENMDIEDVIRNKMIDDMYPKNGELFELDDLDCPICPPGGNTLAEIEWKWDESTNTHQFAEVKSVVCLDSHCPAYCRPIDDLEVIDVFFKSKLNKATIEYLESDRCEPAARMPNMGIEYPE